MRRLSVIALAVFAFAGCGEEYEQGGPLGPPASTTTTRTIPVAPQPEGSQLEMSAPERRMVRDALPAGRRFLSGYLPYMYGRYPALQIRNTTAVLRRQLAINAPRVPPSVAKTTPRVQSLEPSGFLDGRVILLAVVKDGRTTYPLALTLEGRNGRWIVIEAR